MSTKQEPKDRLQVTWEITLTDSQDNNDAIIAVLTEIHKDDKDNIIQDGYAQASAKVPEIMNYLKEQRGWYDPVVLKIEEGEYIFL